MKNLNFDLLDDNGYPTDDLLDFIERFDYRDGWIKLMDIIYDCWFGPSYFSKTEENGYMVYDLSTGGWSGNEDLIAALQSNHMFWAMNWYSSRRGGHYEFKVKLYENQFE